MTVLVLIITHYINDNLINLIKRQYKPDHSISFIMLLDNVSYENFQTKEIIPKHIKCVSIYRSDTCINNKSYDRWDGGGHTLYLKYIKQNQEYVSNFNYVWCVENDVYFSESINEFIKEYNDNTSDVIATQLINIDKSWNWLPTLKGFEESEILLVQSWVMVARFKPNVLCHMANVVGIDIDGYIETLWPNFCNKYNYSLCAMKNIHNSNVTVYKNTLCTEISQLIFNGDDNINEKLNLKKNIIFHPVKLI